MRRFQHGIRQAFLRPVGACFGLTFKQEEQEENAAEADDGSLLPTSGEEEDQQVNANLAVAEFNLHLKVEEGFLPPHKRGDDESDADNLDLQAPYGGQQEQRPLPPNPSGAHQESAAVYNLQMKVAKGCLLPDSGESKEGCLLPESGEDKVSSFLPAIGGGEEDNHDAEISNESNLHTWYACAIQINMQDVVHYSWQQHHCTFVPAINAWLMPSPRPRVKMKGDLQQHDAHAWKHDAWVYSTSPSTSSTPLHLADAKQCSIPFTSLRGREVYQAHERNFKSENPHTALKTKTMVMKMRLYYINKDLLDPG